ncbi:MAG: ABC transporter substrate-binding protein [Chloroflexi bacterium]|nr:ABC transporter substrate-binding protein [Chloroflexota bacterium]
MNARTAVRLLALLSMALLVMGTVGAQGEPAFRIGILDALDGPLSAGAQLAINQVNAAGGIRGADGQQYHLEAVIQGPDVQGSLSTAIGNLSNAGVVAVVGPTTGDQVRNNLQALQNMNVPVLTAAIDDTLLANESTDRLFRARSAEQLHGQALANIIVRDFAITDMQTVLLDPSGTAGQVGFALAVRQLGGQLGTAIIFDPANETIDNLVRRVTQRTPQALVLYGAADVANQFYIGLRAAQYSGIVTYGGADDPEFRGGLSPALLDGLIAPLSWSYALTDESSEQFVLDFARATGRVPGALEAAGYDAVLLIAAGLQRPQSLQESLLALSNIAGAQGPLSPSRLPLGETSDSVAVVQFTASGGAQVLARFENGIRVTEAGDGRPPVVIATPTPRPTNTPTFTPTLDGVYATVLSQALNVRTGPSTVYDILGQLRNGEQVRLIGANLDLTWGVLNFRGLQGWISLAPNLASVAGDLRTLPVVAAPPTPTPGPTSTPAPTATPSQPDVVVLSAVPAVITWGTLTNVSVTVQNAGAGQTGQVAFAASFDPGAVFSGITIPAPGLGSGQSQVINLPVTLSGTTGFYSTVIVADLNNEVNEGPGEGNNGSFIFNYKLDRATSSAGTITLNSGVGINLDGLGGDDLFFSGGTMSAPGVCSPNTASCIGALTVGLDFNSAHHDAISSANGVSLNALGLAFGQTVGFITDGGKRGVLRVDAVSASSVTFSYRVYL